ncbi:MAG TPA: helix-turn-helix transcriptional regulator [Phycisphaerae bacterium]|nr:helix-turn-helix transcriptional regulator [Phycisphaerae bacterium]
MAGNEAFGKRIRELREAKKRADPKYSLRQFAQAVGISATFLSKVETGEFNPPAPEKIKKMAELLGVDSDELLALAGKVDPELPEIIRDQPKAMADFLRTAREQNLTADQIRALTERIREGEKT